MRTLVWLAIVAGGCGPAAWHPIHDEAGSVFDHAWTWTDDTARTVQLAQWRGTPIVMTAFYTTCDSTCPHTLMKLQQVYDQYQREGRHAEFVVLTIDPITDTVERLHAYREEHHLPASWHLLRGDPDETSQLSNLLGVHPMDMEQHVVHEARISLFDERGVRTEMLDVI